MRSSHNTTIKENLNRFGLRPGRLLRFLEQSIEVEQEILKFNKQFMEEEEYNERATVVSEMQILVIVLSDF